MSARDVRPALLVLADGEVFEGEALGATPPDGIATGEVVFNTVLSGYQEVMSDPSYAGQVITFTSPHIGNYGVTRHIRDRGAVPGAFGTADEAALLAAARAEPGTDGVDLVAQVTTAAPYAVGDGPRRVVAYDFGIKTTILRHLSGLATVEVVPASTSAAEVLARRPDGVFLSNGPGDPATVPYAVEAIQGLIGEVPLFGICLGNQLLGRAVGAETVKLPFGHHGGNHPVRDVRSGRIDITSQNHNFAVAADTLPAGAELTHVNLNDGVCEGFALPAERAFSVQHHPEAGPGPHDAAHLFTAFDELMGRG
jgi:carbamoyl-phosphate synthase small subunit